MNSSELQLAFIKSSFISTKMSRFRWEAEFRYFDGQDEWIWRQEPSSDQIAARTVAMLGARIMSLESKENGTLALTFSNGHCLTMLDSFKEYESYDITRPSQTIIV